MAQPVQTGVGRYGHTHESLVGTLHTDCDNTSPYGTCEPLAGLLDAVVAVCQDVQQQGLLRLGEHGLEVPEAGTGSTQVRSELSGIHRL